MSLFKVNDINKVLFSFLTIDDLRSFRQVNKHYKDSIFEHIENFYNFFSKELKDIEFGHYNYYNETYINFYKSVIYGKLEIVKYLVNKYQHNINEDHEFAFRLSISYNHIDIANWILPKVQHISDSVGEQDICYAVIHHGNINMFEWIIANCHKKFLSVKDYILKIIKYRNLEIIKWLFTKPIKFSKKIFIEACSNEDINVPQYIFKALQITESKNGFYNACTNNRIDTFLWLCSINNLDINTIPPWSDRTYCRCVLNGHLDMLKILLTFKYTDDILHRCFDCACQKRHIDIMKYIVEHHQINVHFDNDMFLQTAIRNGYESITMYIFSLDDIKNFEYSLRYDCFERACGRKYFNIMQILLPYISIPDVIHCVITSCRFADMIDTLKWFIDKINIFDTRHELIMTARDSGNNDAVTILENIQKKMIY